MKRLAVFMFIFALAAAFAAPSFAADKVVVKIAGSKPDGNPQTIGMRTFAKRLGELSNGKYDVQVFPHNQLGKEDNYLTQTRNGTIQMCCVGPSLPASILPWPCSRPPCCTKTLTMRTAP